jgi:hypothetical protein
MVIGYHLPSNLLKRKVSNILMDKLVHRKKGDVTIDNILAFLDYLREKDVTYYNIFMSSMIVMYYEVEIIPKVLNKKRPDIYNDDEIELLGDFLDSVDNYQELSNAVVNDNHLITMFLLAAARHGNLDMDEKDIISLAARREVPELYESFNPCEKMDNMILKVKDSMPFEDNFEAPILEGFMKLKKAGCSYKLAILNICKMLTTHHQFFSQEQYERGMRGIIIKYYVFKKSLLELGNNLEDKDQVIIDFIDNKNNNFQAIFNFVSQKDNCQSLIEGFISYQLCATSHFNNQVHTIDKQNGFSSQLKKRFNN